LDFSLDLKISPEIGITEPLVERMDKKNQHEAGFGVYFPSGL
jgi:hypothetical protein